jgi:hypothetical protein
MNYHYADRIYKKYRLEHKLRDDFFQKTGHEFASECKKLGTMQVYYISSDRKTLSRVTHDLVHPKGM